MEYAVIYVIIGASLGLCFFIGSLWAYRRGVKDGMAMAKGNTPPPIQTPVQAVQSRVEARKEAKAAKEQEDAVTTGLMNLLAYNGDPQKAGEG